MIDSQSRKILRYIKKHGKASFHEIVEHFPNQELIASIIVNLNVNEYTIRVGNENCEKTQAVYELQAKVVCRIRTLYKTNDLSDIPHNYIVFLIYHICSCIS